MKFLKRSLLLFVLMNLFAIIFATPAYASQSLNPALWYAVVWNRSTDTLHWINHVGEQASIPRPKLPNEAGYGISFYISPNGRYMVIHGMLNTGRDGLGFYDLQAGAFLQTHEAQPGEVIITTEHNPFTLNSQYVALGLRTETSWRVIAFDTTTGHSVAEITSAHPSLPQGYIPMGSLPIITLYDVEQGFGQYRVHVRFLPNGPVQPDVQMLGFSWMPALNMVQFDTIPANIHQFDMLAQSGQIAYMMNDPMMPMTNSGIYTSMLGHFDTPSVIFNQSNALASAPKWVAGGLMIAYRVAQQPYATMWHLVPAVGGQSIPFAPEYDYLYGTPDGFLIANLDAGHIKFSNTLQFEAFTPTIGNVVYSTNTATFSVVYVTPIGASFSLTSIANTTPLVGVDAVGGVDIAQPNNNTPVPPVAGVNTVGGVNVAPPPVQPTATPNNIVVAPPVQPTNPPNIVVAPPVQPTATQLPPRAPVGDGDCSQAVPQEIGVGIPSITTDIGGTFALRTNLHDEFPSHQIGGNNLVTVIGGPLCNKGHRMWRISVTLNGQEVTGYVSEGVNGVRYIRKL